jgi:CheY-like chemotaxis protein
MSKHDKRILIVDDQKEVLELIAEAIGDEGYTVITANHPGLGAARAPYVDCIILDLQLSPDKKMEGGSIMSHVWDDVWCDIPIIVFSGMVGSMNIDEALEMIEEIYGKGRNLFRCISKSEGLEPLIAAVNDWYKTTEHSEALEA